MRIDLLKFSVGKQETKQGVTPCEPARFTGETVKSLTTLDTIGLVALIVFQLGLSQCMRIEYGNPKEKDE